MLNEFLQYLESKVGKCIYVWGAQGEKGAQITEAWIRRRETSADNANKAIAFWHELKKRVPVAEIEAYDCSGLAMYFLYNQNRIIKGDTTAHGLMNMCERISDKSELKPGDFVFIVNSSGRATHAGYVVDEKHSVIESRALNRNQGVVKRPLSAGSWNRYGRPKFFKGEIGKDAARILKLTSPMMRGEDVVKLQERLLDLSYSPGAIDGIFGKKTQAALKKYQQTHGLTVSGEVDAATKKSLKI